MLVNTACLTILILIESMDGAVLHPGYFGNFWCMCVCDMQPSDVVVTIYSLFKTL